MTAARPMSLSKHIVQETSARTVLYVLETWESDVTSLVCASGFFLRSKETWSHLIKPHRVGKSLESVVWFVRAFLCVVLLSSFRFGRGFGGSSFWIRLSNPNHRALSRGQRISIVYEYN